MTDRFGRTIEYLRISLTDLCNLRCVYCMPAEGVGKLRHGQILSIEEICEIAEAAVALGIRKIRLTGGEPLVRRGVVELVRMLKALPGLDELALTTNGLLLPELAGPLKEAGLDRVNISLDTLDADKYRRLTRIGSLDQALAGIRAAQEAGLAPIKLNAVLIEIGEDAAEQEAERKEADAGMRYRSWLALIESAREIPDAERLLAEIGGPTWIEAYTPDECVRICEAAVAVAGDGIRGLLTFLGTSQAAFADRYLIPRRSVENWCTRSEINHRDCPAYVVSLLSYAALRDAGII